LNSLKHIFITHPIIFIAHSKLNKRRIRMKRAFLVFVAIFAGLLVFLAISASGSGETVTSNREATQESNEEQAVAGNHYFGQFQNSCGQRATSCMAFDRNGDVIAWDQHFGAGPVELFSGTYNERRSGRNSLWFAVMTEPSGDNTFFLGGYTIRSNFTIMLLVNTDATCPDSATAPIAFGIYSKSDCIPGQRFGFSEEEGWTGGVDIDTE
jgi:hypothetical protein